jgi:hypothetical protein
MPRVSIGLVDGEAAYVLSGIRDVRLLPDGQVVVADGGSQTVRIYSDEGRFQDQMGGRGEGPGEFTYLAYLSVAAPDTIMAYDALALRLTRFRATGEFLSTQQFHVDTGNPERYIGTYSDGRHAMAWIDLGTRRDPGVVTPDAMQIGRFHQNGTLEALLGTSPGMRRLGSPVPFSPHFLAAMFQGELFFTDGMGGVVRGFNAQGDSLPSFQVPVERWSLDEAWRRLEDRLPDEEAVQALREIKATPGTDSIPDFSEMLVDDAGRLWLKRYDPATDSHRLTRPRRGGEWLVVERSGRVLATVPIPSTLRPVDIRGNRVAGIARDDLGVERVEVFDLLVQ